MEIFSLRLVGFVCAQKMRSLSIISVFVAIVIVSWETHALADYRLEKYEDNGCNMTGLMCKNCRELVFYTTSANGSCEEVPIDICPPNKICLSNICIEKETSQCSPTAQLSFPCSSVGVFPNPGDCRKYHFCVPGKNPRQLQGIAVKCEQSDGVYAYNAMSTSCDIRLSDGQCPSYPIPLCTYVGDTNALPTNPTIYYVCAAHPENRDVLYPFQMKCPNGKTFNTAYGCS